MTALIYAYLVIWAAICPVCRQEITIEEKHIEEVYKDARNLVECPNCHCAVWAKVRHCGKI